MIDFKFKRSHEFNESNFVAFGKAIAQADVTSTHEQTPNRNESERIRQDDGGRVVRAIFDSSLD